MIPVAEPVQRAARRRRAPSAGGRSDSFRPEIHALRALAVTLVVVFHLWPARLPGGFVGVDVFFVISGFLITAHLVRETRTTGTIDLAQFWARRVRRLLPAALLVLAATLVGTVAFLPEPLWQSTVVQVAAAAGYALNWVLAGTAVDYFAADEPATAVQHYWSLSVEEQFYLVWPLLVLGLLAVARHARAGRRHARVPSRRVLVPGIAVVAALSLGYSIWYSARSGAAYFSTLTHAWEFAAGGLLSFALPTIERRTRSAPRLRAGAALLGSGVLVACGFLLTGAVSFPGWIAVVPVAGVLAVIAAGDTSRSAFSPYPLVTARPVQWLGEISYSVYLWHWPLIVLVPHVLGRELTTVDRLAVLAATLGLAHATKVLVEDPVRFSRTLRSRTALSFAAAAACMVVVAGASAGLWQRVEVRTARAEAVALAAVSGEADPCYGAGAVLSGADCPGPYRADPDLVLAKSAPLPDPTPVVPSTGLAADEYRASSTGPTVALVGDSHARMYLTGLLDLAVRNDWRLLEIRHNDCTPSAPTWESTFSTDMKDTCQQFRRDLIDLLAPASEVDLVVTSSVAPRYADMPGADHSLITAAFEQTYRSWLDAGRKVLVIADVPGPSEDVGEVPACVAAAADLDDACASPREEVLELDLQAVAARDLAPEGLTLVDFSDRYCDASTCHATIGGVVMYASGAHISGVFSASLAPYLEEPVLRTLSGP